LIVGYAGRSAAGRRCGDFADHASGFHRFFTVPASGLHARGIGLWCGQAAGWISHIRACGVRSRFSS